MKNKLKSNLILLAIVILAAFLRLILLGSFPNGLNADEAAIGYNAYSLIQTGRDEHGVSWPMVFRSFDDYKPAVYFYLVLPFIKVLGLNVWAVRLPSALLGILSVYLLYLLTNQIFSSKLSFSKVGEEPRSEGRVLTLGHLASLLLAISPWHLQFSRGGWEVNTASTFFLLGLVFFFKALKKPALYFFWIISHILALYTYHSMRVVIPLLDLYLLFTSGSVLEVKKNRHLLLSLLLGFILCLPLAKQMLSSAGQSRFAGVSIFADQGPIQQAIQFRNDHSLTSLPVKLLHNRYVFYGLRFFQNITKHYSDDFLFFTGDEIGRSRVPDTGQSYLWTLPFFAFGLWFLSSRLDKKNGLILFWFLVGSFAAALTFQSPHALRSQNICFPFQIIIATGIYQVFLWLKKIKFTHLVLSLCLGLISLYGLARYLHNYYLHYPYEIPYAWQPGFQELGGYLKDHESQYERIIISTRYDQPYILIAFFLKYPPEKLQKELIFSTPDQFGFSTGLNFGKYYFKPIDFDQDSKNNNTLLIVADEPVAEKTIPIKTIYYPNGDPIFRLYKTYPPSSFVE